MFCPAFGFKECQQIKQFFYLKMKCLDLPIGVNIGSEQKNSLHDILLLSFRTALKTFFPK